MTTYSVVFSLEAEDSLVSLHDYIAEHGSLRAAQRYTDAIVTYCESLATFPHRGMRRDATTGTPLVTTPTGTIRPLQRE